MLNYLHNNLIFTKNMALTKFIGVNLRNLDLLKFRFVVSKLSPEGFSLPLSQVIKKLILDEYERLIKQYPGANDVTEYIENQKRKNVRMDF